MDRQIVSYLKLRCRDPWTAKLSCFLFVMTKFRLHINRDEYVQPQFDEFVSLSYVHFLCGISYPLFLVTPGFWPPHYEMIFWVEWGGITSIGQKRSRVKADDPTHSSQKQVIFCQSGRSFRVKADDLWVKTDDLCVKPDDAGRKRKISGLKADDRIWIF